MLGAYVHQAVLPWLMTKTGPSMQVGNNCTAGQFEACSRHLARAERAVSLAGKAAGLAGMGQQAAPPGKVCGFPPSGSLPGSGVADLAGVCAVCQTVKEPRRGGNESLHCQDSITGELSKVSWLEFRIEICRKHHSQMPGGLLTIDAHTQRLFRPTILPPCYSFSCVRLLACLH